MLLGLLEDRDDFTAHMAAFALREVGGAEVVEPMLAAGKARPGMVRHNVMNALDDLGALYRGFELALDSTADRESWVRHSAYACLADVDWKKGVEEAIPVLVEAMENEPDADAKAAAERTLRVLRARQ